MTYHIFISWLIEPIQIVVFKYAILINVSLSSTLLNLYRLLYLNPVDLAPYKKEIN